MSSEYQNPHPDPVLNLIQAAYALVEGQTLI